MERFFFVVENVLPLLECRVALWQWANTLGALPLVDTGWQSCTESQQGQEKGILGVPALL